MSKSIILFLLTVISCAKKRELDSKCDKIFTSLISVNQLAAQDMANLKLSPAARDSVMRQYRGQAYFTLSLAHEGHEIENQFVGDPATYAKALQYLNGGLAADTWLITPAQDSVPALAAMYIRQYGTTGKSSVMLTFNIRSLDLSQGATLTFPGPRLRAGHPSFSLFCGCAVGRYYR